MEDFLAQQEDTNWRDAQVDEIARKLGKKKEEILQTHPALTNFILISADSLGAIDSPKEGYIVNAGFVALLLTERRDMVFVKLEQGLTRGDMLGKVFSLEETHSDEFDSGGKYLGRVAKYFRDSAKLGLVKIETSVTDSYLVRKANDSLEAWKAPKNARFPNMEDPKIIMIDFIPNSVQMTEPIARFVGTLGISFYFGAMKYDNLCFYHFVE